jgi:hypothetical protein
VCGELEQHVHDEPLILDVVSKVGAATEMGRYVTCNHIAQTQHESMAGLSQIRAQVTAWNLIYRIFTVLEVFVINIVETNNVY